MSTTSELLNLLRHHYIARTAQPGARAGGVFAHEVGMNGRWGGPGTHRADAIYAGFTSSSGRIMVGHEIKVSRSDWRAELSKAGKADAWADACHQWWIVAPSTNIVPPEELPEGWGLMLPPRSSRAKHMQIAVEASTKTDHDPPWWAVRSLMARVETLQHESRLVEIERLVDARVAERNQYLESRAAEPLSPEQRTRLDTLERLEKALGFSVTHWKSELSDRRISARDLARAIQLATATATDSTHLVRMLHVVEEIERTAGKLRETIPAATELTKVEERA